MISNMIFGLYGYSMRKRFFFKGCTFRILYSIIYTNEKLLDIES